ncbi:MAG: hypothetical protein B6U72_04890 [Candidatus Altiarchaeales archaeon ex4484_2]|nr:MAG: hypothetical protein B6U72_04890 [Candidatus Altiarchaeales archaeon ex4484_2]
MDEEKRIIPTNIEGLDEILGGGLPAGSCVLLLAPPVVETHLFCLEFIYRGLVNKEPGLIVTMNYAPEELKIRGLKYGWAFVQGERNGIMKWVDGYSYNANKDVKSTDAIKRIGGSIALSDLTIGMTQAQQEFHTKAENYRFALDSLSTLFIYNNPNTIYRFMRAIIPKLRMSGGIGFLLLGSGMHDPQIETTLRYMVDGTIQLDDNLKIKTLNLPFPSPKKSAKLELGKKGFRVVDCEE